MLTQSLASLEYALYEMTCRRCSCAVNSMKLQFYGSGWCSITDLNMVGIWVWMIYMAVTSELSSWWKPYTDAETVEFGELIGQQNGLIF